MSYVLFEDGSSIRRTTDLSHAVAVPANQTRTYQLAVVVSGDEQWWSNQVALAGVKRAPTVASLGITSLPGADGIYAIGDVVQVTVSSEENLTVTGAPTLALDFDGAAKIASYAETAGSAVTFAYTVAEGDGDADGVAIPANALGLNGGTIRDGAGNDLILTHEAVAADSGHRVDGVRPTFASAAVSADGAAVSLAFSEPIGVPPLLTTLAEQFNLQVAVFYIAVMDLMVDGRPVDVGGAAITQGRLVLRPKNAIAQSQTVTVAYDNIYAAHAAGLFIDAAGNALRNFAAQGAVNNSTVSEAAPVDDASDVVTLSRNEIKVGEGQTETYTVQLASEPSTSVEVSIASAIGEGQLTAEGYEVDGGLLLNTDKLTFTTDNWNAAQTITLRAPEDANRLNHWVTLRHATGSEDSSFDGLRTKVRVVMADND